MALADRLGTVYLVGAGPGDPGLITARGLDLLQTADALVHDRLVSPDLIAKHPLGAEVHDVGKVPGQHGRGRQREINDLLVALARQGKTVVRLKGGDPFVFGRGGEEAEACAEAGVPFEVVPGISAAIAVPAYAGIPLTHRAIASSFAVVTGQEDPSKSESRTNWAALAHIDTLVILMGVERLPWIVACLMAHGRPAETPVAVVSRGTYPAQQTITGTLADIVTRAPGDSLRAPVTIVVGEVVRRRDHIRWFDQRPLFGKRILLPRTRDKHSVLVDRFRDLGAATIEAPQLMVQSMPDRLTGALDRLSAYDLILFTDPNAVRTFWSALGGRGLDARALAGTRIAAAGPGTLDALHGMGMCPDISTAAYAPTPVAQMVLDSGPPRNVLLLRQEGLPDELTERLRDAGARVDHIAISRVMPAGQFPDFVEVDVVVFPSSGSVRVLSELLEATGEQLRDTPAVCMGPSTAAAARGSGYRVQAIADTATFEGLIAATLALFPEEARDAIAGCSL